MTALKITYNLCFITHHVESRQQLSVSSWSFVDSISELHKYANLPRNQNTQSTLVDQIINFLTGKREKNWQKWKRRKPKRGYCNVPQNDANCKKLHERISGGQVSMLWRCAMQVSCAQWKKLSNDTPADYIWCCLHCSWILDCKHFNKCYLEKRLLCVLKGPSVLT